MSTEKVQKETPKVRPNLEPQNLNQALLSVQVVIKSAKKSSDNPYFKSKYADLSSVYEAVRKPFNDACILIQQVEDENIIPNGDSLLIKNYIITKLIFVPTGEMIENRTEIVCKEKNNPQAYGSAITYARRYGLMTVCGVDTEDDDGNSASTASKSKQPEVLGLSKSKILDIIGHIEEAQSLEGLQNFFLNLGEYKKAREVVEAKDAKKKELTEKASAEVVTVTKAVEETEEVTLLKAE